MKRIAVPGAALLLVLAACQAEYAASGSDAAPEAVAKAAARSDTDTWRARVTGL